VARFGMTDLVRFLVGHQFEYLRKSGPDALRTTLDDSGAAGRHRFVEAVTNSFVRETSAGLAHSREVVGPLKNRFKMGIVSNFYGNLDRVLVECRLDKLISAVADSSKIGVFKPELGIFNDAIRQLRIAPGQIAMIGDSLAKDCAPAHRLGMSSVWLCDEGARESAKDWARDADRTIQSIDELAELEW